MSDLHQYELHYLGVDGISGGETTLVRLVWAYTVQEAVFQFDLAWKARTRLDPRITEAGPVKQALVYQGVAHFHVCAGCQEVGPCAGCKYPEQSDLQEPCRKCIGRKPHKHYCVICEIECDCGWIEKNGSCWMYDARDMPCTAHTYVEAQAFFQKKFDAEKKATR